MFGVDCLPRLCALALAAGMFGFPSEAIAQVDYGAAKQDFEQKLDPQKRFTVQLMLIAAGYSAAVPMDHFDRGVLKSLLTFQQDNSYAPDGRLHQNQVDRLVGLAAGKLQQWGFERITHPTRPVSIWAPTGLDLLVENKPLGVHFTDRQGRLELDFLSYPHSSVARDYHRTFDQKQAAGWTIYYAPLNDTEKWFVISAHSPDGHDHYYRYNQDGSAVTGFALEWNNAAGNINAERIADIMSGSLRAAMMGSPYGAPPILNPVPVAPPASAAVQPSQQPSSDTTAAQGNDPAGCSAVREPAARLACFDASTAAHKAGDLQPPPPQPATNAAPREENRSVAAMEPQKAVPAPVKTALGTDDLAAMHSTYEKNQARFFRDYKSREFSATMPLHSVIEDIMQKGTFVVSFGTSWNGDVSCHVSDQATIDLITNSDKGDKIIVDGTVDDHTLGTVNLTNCHLEHS